MLVQQNFLQGRLNLDADERLVQNGQLRNALNVRVTKSEGSNIGAIENILGNEALSSLGFTNVVTLGSEADTTNERIYWFIHADERDAILEWDKNTDTVTSVLSSNPSGVLNFDPTKRIDNIDIIFADDTLGNFLFWTDNFNPPRKINIERAKTYAHNSFDELDISVMKPAPLNPPTLTLSNTVSEAENNIEEKFLFFCVRYKYIDGEYSAYSPFARKSFYPRAFQYDFATSTNESMVNRYNLITIDFNTGGSNVTDIDILFKESGGNTVYRVERFNKSKLGYADNTTESFEFDNSKIYAAEPEKELNRFFDNVPLLALTQEYIGNRIGYGNYEEGYDIAECNGTPIQVDYSLDLVSSAIVSVRPTLKSNRDYEIAIAYLDEWGRITTPLTSITNTIYIPNSAAITENKIQVTIDSLPPCHATHYRFFIKQSKIDYQIILPTQFYEEGVYSWIKLENSDRDKLQEGDVLIVKADSTGILDDLVYTKVLAIEEKEENFLSRTPVTDASDIVEEPGLYFKVRDDEFRMDRDDFTFHEKNSYDNTRNKYDNPIRGTLLTYAELPVFYGTSNENGLTVDESGYIPTEDHRYTIEIDGVVAPDTFRFKVDDGAWLEPGTPITAGVPQALGTGANDTGIMITFPVDTGHDLADSWVVSVKYATDDGFGGQENSKAYAIIESLDVIDPTGINENDSIEGGARISITYSEYGEGNTRFTITKTASRRYANLEEFWFGDDVDADLIAEGFPLTQRWFRRGDRGSDGNATTYEFNPDGNMFLIMRSIASQNSDADGRVKVATSITIFQSSTPIILETKPDDLNTDIFYELGETYEITGGFHQGETQNQTGVQPAISVLDTYNAFAYGNGVESYKVKDLYNSKSLKFDTRPLIADNEYKKIRRTASITYSEPLVEDTKSNGLNVFNLSTANYRDLEKRYGSIQKIFFRDDNILVLQEDKCGQLLYNRDAIFKQDGTFDLVTVSNVLGAYLPYTGEYGISRNPESFAIWGNRVYFTDAKRGCVIRLSIDGITEISRYGLYDYFKDAMRNNIYDLRLGAYNPYFDEYVLNFNKGEENITLSFSEENNGWTSFYSYQPSQIQGLNNLFFSFKNGELYIHNSENVPRNNFYGVQYTSKVTVIFNQEASFDKMFESIVLEGTHPWDATLTTNLNNSNILSEEFSLRESRWFAYTRRALSTTDFTGLNISGIGEITNVAGSNISYSAIPSSVCIGDILYQLNGVTQEQVGAITGIDLDTNIITVASIVITPVVGRFSFSVKEARIEGTKLRGYFLECELENTSTEFVELYAVNCEENRSFVAS